MWPDVQAQGATCAPSAYTLWTSPWIQGTQLFTVRGTDTCCHLEPALFTEQRGPFLSTPTGGRSESRCPASCSSGPWLWAGALIDQVTNSYNHTPGGRGRGERSSEGSSRTGRPQAETRVQRGGWTQAAVPVLLRQLPGLSPSSREALLC